jgi:Condensation domain/TubC N-terminal docking domain
VSTAEFLAHLRRLDVRLWADGERLRTSAPTGVLTPALLAELTARKAAILAFLRTATGAAHTAAPPLHAMPRAGDLPLSFAQQRLWFLDQLVAGSPVYNIARAFRLHGPLDLPALIQSIDEIVRCHEVLRTTFAVVDEQPVQVIVPSLTVRVPVVELWDLPALERESEAQRLAVEEAQRPFDLAREPLIRSTLLQLGQEEHILLLTMHHIVSDGWSANILYREIATLYEAFTARQPSPLPELPIQYADFALWQRQWLQGAVLEKHLAYWKEQLRGSPPLLDLPTDHPRPTQQTFRGALRPLHLSAALTRALTALSQQAGATLFMTLLAAFKILLARYTAQADIVVGTPIAHRTRVELEPLIGCFVNTLVLRTDLSGNPGFWDVLRRVQHTAVEAYAHQDLPFERLVEELRPERTLSHAL